MNTKHASPEATVRHLHTLLKRIEETMVDVELIAGDEMGGEFDEAVKFIHTGLDQAWRVLTKW